MCVVCEVHFAILSELILWVIKVWTVWVIELNCLKISKVMAEENQTTIELNRKSWNCTIDWQTFSPFSTIRPDRIPAKYTISLKNQTFVKFVCVCAFQCLYNNVIVRAANGHYELRLFTAIRARVRISEMRINHGSLIEIWNWTAHLH